MKLLLLIFLFLLFLKLKRIKPKNLKLFLFFNLNYSIFLKHIDKIMFLIEWYIRLGFYGVVLLKFFEWNGGDYLKTHLIPIKSDLKSSYII